MIRTVIVCEPTAAAIASAINRYAGDRSRAAAHGDAGFERGRLVTWDGVIGRLLAD